jgi:hypothetical protein
MENLKEKYELWDQGANGKVISKQVLNKYVVVEMGSTGSGQRPVQSYSEEDNGSTVSGKAEEFLFQLGALASRALRSNLRAATTQIQEMLGRTYSPFLL